MNEFCKARTRGNGWRTYGCTKRAKDGSVWCATHDPEAVQKREAKKQRTYDLKWQTDTAKAAVQRAERELVAYVLHTEGKRAGDRLELLAHDVVRARTTLGELQDQQLGFTPAVPRGTEGHRG